MDRQNNNLPFTPGEDFPMGMAFTEALSDGLIKYHPDGYVDDCGFLYDPITLRCIGKVED